jgi:DNA-binding protein YbaB
MIIAEDYRMDIVDHPKEILIERGWVKYFNVVVTNSGNGNLNNVTIYFDGEFPQWFEVQTNKTDVLQINNNASFLVKLNVLSTAESGTYSFILYAKSKEITDSKTFSIRVFKSKSDMMLYQVQKLEIEIEDMQRNVTKAENLGKNVTGVINVLNEAKDYLETSKSYIDKEEYEKATNLMINVENLIKEAIFDLSIAPSKNVITSISEVSFEWVVIPFAIIIATVIIFYMFKRRKREGFIKTPVVKIKEIVLEGKDVKNLENELKKIENSANLLEEEFKENLISKESYDELKAKYERRITELKSEIERNKKII